jgi:predicted RNase H-like HicB family nuclease
MAEDDPIVDPYDAPPDSEPVTEEDLARIAGTRLAIERGETISTEELQRRLDAEFHVRLTVKFDREEDGRWIGDVPEFHGCHVYGANRNEARVKVKALALRVLADRMEHGEAAAPETITFTTEGNDEE